MYLLINDKLTFVTEVFVSPTTGEINALDRPDQYRELIQRLQMESGAKEGNEITDIALLYGSSFSQIFRLTDETKGVLKSTVDPLRAEYVHFASHEDVDFLLNSRTKNVIAVPSTRSVIITCSRCDRPKMLPDVVSFDDVYVCRNCLTPEDRPGVGQRACLKCLRFKVGYSEEYWKVTCLDCFRLCDNEEKNKLKSLFGKDGKPAFLGPSKFPPKATGRGGGAGAKPGTKYPPRSKAMIIKKDPPEDEDKSSEEEAPVRGICRKCKKVLPSQNTKVFCTECFQPETETTTETVSRQCSGCQIDIPVNQRIWEGQKCQKCYLK